MGGKNGGMVLIGKLYNKVL